MSEEVNQNSQTQNGQDGQSQVGQDSNKGQVAQDESKSVGGLKYYKDLLEKERNEREKIQSELEAVRTSKLKEQNNWKELYENEQKKAQEYQTKLTTISTALVEDKMRSAIEREASKLGILPSALEDLDLMDKSIIEVETTSTGKVNFNNVKEFVETVRSKRPYWFGANQDPNINNKRPDHVQNRDLSVEEILDLQNKDPKKYTEYMQQKLRK